MCHWLTGCATGCLQEGELRPQLLDRFGLSVNVGTLQVSSSQYFVVYFKYLQTGRCRKGTRDICSSSVNVGMPAGVQCSLVYVSLACVALHRADVLTIEGCGICET